MFSALQSCHISRNEYQLVVNTVVFLCYTVGLLLMALPPKTVLKMLGVFCNGLGLSIGDKLLTEFTALYNDTTVHTYNAGTGVGYVFIIFFYTGKY